MFWFDDTPNLEGRQTELGVIVDAPNDIIWARSDKTYTIGPTRYRNTGEMKMFKPERK